MSGFDLASYHRLTIKVGSSLLINAEGHVNHAWLKSLADDLAMLQKNGHEILVVSSGAIAIGSKILNISKRRAKLEDLQAAAAAGQAQLVNAWQNAFANHDVNVAQILLTPEDTENRRRFLNARGTLARLLDQSVVPIINENDTVATEEIRYGDNDRLAARVAQLVMADALILLSDVDGLYTEDPGKNDNAVHIPEVRNITDDIARMATETRSGVGSGGMATKVQAARIATHAGCSTVVTSGVISWPLATLAAGGRCTVFCAEGTPASARKQWLAGVLEVRGELRLDEGAARALLEGSSLLPIGLVEVIGSFRRGDVVTLIDASGNELGRGLAEYSNSEATQLIGCHSEKIEERLGYRARSVMIHRDQLVIFDHER